MTELEELRAKVKALESTHEAIKTMIIENEPLGALVETLFYGPLREAESERDEAVAALRGVLREADRNTLSFQRAHAVLARYPGGNQ
jgi:hypothetical protein